MFDGALPHRALRVPPREDAALRYAPQRTWQLKRPRPRLAPRAAPLARTLAPTLARTLALSLAFTLRAPGGSLPTLLRLR